MTLSIDFIRGCIASGSYELSLHADTERLNEGLTIEQLEDALRSAEMLEDYPTDPRGPSCLVLGRSDDRPIHVVCGLTKQQRMLIITVYEPAMPKWLDERTRRP